MGVLSSSVRATVFTISPDMTNVSDGIGSYRIFTVPEKDIPARTPSFGRVQSCIYIIDIPVGSKDGNVSHGALCLRELGNNVKSVFVCYDDMIGHSALLYVDKNSTNKRNLIQFVMTNCFGG